MSYRAFVLATVATFAMISMAQFAHHPTAPPAGTCGADLLSRVIRTS
jgi:hypothetical protein